MVIYIFLYELWFLFLGYFVFLFLNVFLFICSFFIRELEGEREFGLLNLELVNFCVWGDFVGYIDDCG